MSSTSSNQPAPKSSLTSVDDLSHDNFGPASSRYNLRPRGHDFILPSVKTARHMNSFVMRTLFKFK